MVAVDGGVNDGEIGDVVNGFAAMKKCFLLGFSHVFRLAYSRIVGPMHS